MIDLKQPEDFLVSEGQKKAIVGGSCAGTEAPFAPGRNGVPVNKSDNDDNMFYFVNVFMEINLVFGIPSVDQPSSLYLGVYPLFQAADQKLLHVLFPLQDFPHKKTLDVPLLIILVGILFVFLDNRALFPRDFGLDLFNFFDLLLEYLFYAKIFTPSLLKLFQNLFLLTLGFKYHLPNTVGSIQKLTHLLFKFHWSWIGKLFFRELLLQKQLLFLDARKGPLLCQDYFFAIFKRLSLGSILNAKGIHSSEQLLLQKAEFPGLSILLFPFLNKSGLESSLLELFLQALPFIKEVGVRSLLIIQLLRCLFFLVLEVSALLDFD